MSIFIIFILILSTIIYFLPDNPLSIGNIEFYIYIGLFIYDLYRRKGITLIQVWIIAYLYIINSEILLYPELFQGEKIWAVQFLGISNNCVIFGYYLKHSVINNFKHDYKRIIPNRKTKTIYLTLVIALLIAFVADNLSHALIARGSGRQAATEEQQSFDLFSMIIGNCRYVLPAIIAYYYSKTHSRFKILYAFTLSLPIFLILFWNGSRFPLLFSFLGFLIASNLVNIRRLNRKSILIGCIAFILLNNIGDLMKMQRVFGVNAVVEENSRVAYPLLSQNISENFSPEGVVKMTNSSHEYFKTNGHLYGVSTGFLLYFWIPRIAWPDKPAMLGYWLIRTQEISGFASGHSVSFGFVGDLYADFGIFSLIFCILLGLLIKYLDNYCVKALASDKFNRVFAAMLYPWVFFIVRSPITGTIALIGMSSIYLLFKFVLRNSKA